MLALAAFLWVRVADPATTWEGDMWDDDEGRRYGPRLATTHTVVPRPMVAPGIPCRYSSSGVELQGVSVRKPWRAASRAALPSGAPSPRGR